jgi:hypothetical protein
MELFGRHRHHEPKPLSPEDKDYIPPQPDAVCPHTDLIAHWDNAADMGHEDKISGYRCESCHKIFSAAEAQALRADEAERVQGLIEVDESQRRPVGEEPF